MKKITAFILMSATLAISTEALTPRLANAQLFYPPASDRNSLMVIGQGIVKVPADTADIELVIGTDSNNNELESQLSSLPISLRSSSTNVLLNQQKPAPISRKLTLASQIALNQATLKPIVDSLVAKGIRANNIKVQPSENQAKILVRLEKPTSDRVKEIIATANAATNKLDNLTINNVGVNYAVTDCQALQSAAYQSAMKDAQSRAQALATAMGAKLGNASVAEPFYTLLYPSCSSKAGLPLPSFGGLLSFPSFNPDNPAEVEMKKDIFVTYTVQ
ncbi:SIMPL domain-containing protein [Nostoc sp. CCY0012]|uniref:SIMPL domain-containing protein n=1 Tax=Nostoc sp. CCY0012 TaxID=1056123 RepID=UPI0039C62DC0